MGGEIGFESSVGSGSQFFFALPLTQSAVPAAALRPKILHVEDDALTREVVREALGEIAEVSYALTLESAAKRVWEERFDVVILDISLPDGDGLDLLALMPEGEVPVPQIVLYTAGEVPPFLARLVQASHSTLATSCDTLVDTIRALLLPHAVQAGV
jgi:DNA-binding NarL/FixJ family response regulator